MMNKEFVPYQEALDLIKELGFNEPCLGNFADDENHTLFTNGNRPGKTNAPTYSQAFRFFREKYELYHIIHCPTKDVAVFTITGFDVPSVHSDVELKSYEEAELACLRALIRRARESTIGENTGPRG